MAKEKDEGEFYIELQKDYGYRGAHLGKGFVLDLSGDPRFAKYLCLDPAMARRVDKPDTPPEKPWENIPEVEPVRAKHPTEPRVYADAPKKK